MSTGTAASSAFDVVLAKIAGAVSRKPDGSPNTLHAISDCYEKLLPFLVASEDITDDPEAYEAGRPLQRKAYAFSEAVGAKLKHLRHLLAALPAADLDELARKAWIARRDSADWLVSPDPLHRSLCDDVLRLTGAEPVFHDAPIDTAMVQAIRDADFEAPPMPWEAAMDRENEADSSNTPSAAK